MQASFPPSSLHTRSSPSFPPLSSFVGMFTACHPHVCVPRLLLPKRERETKERKNQFFLLKLTRGERREEEKEIYLQGGGRGGGGWRRLSLEILWLEDVFSSYFSFLPFFLYTGKLRFLLPLSPLFFPSPRLIY